MSQIWRQHFRRIDLEHLLGSASLARAYWVTLDDGSDAVVKIRRTGVRSVVLRDMKQIRRIAR